MRRFHQDERVRVVETADLAPDVWGLTGRVHRLRRGDDGAWVAMDVLPDNYRTFPIGDDRANDLLLYPEHCEPATPARAGGRR